VTVKLRAPKYWLRVAALLVSLASLFLISQARARRIPENSGLEITYLGNEGVMISAVSKASLSRSSRSVMASMFRCPGMSSRLWRRGSSLITGLRWCCDSYSRRPFQLSHPRLAPGT